MKRKERQLALKIARPNKVREIVQAGETLPLTHKWQNRAKGRAAGARDRVPSAPREEQSCSLAAAGN